VLWHLGEYGASAGEGAGISRLLDHFQQFGDHLRGVGLELWHGLQTVWVLALVVSEDGLMLGELLEKFDEDVHGMGGDITLNGSNVVG